MATIEQIQRFVHGATLETTPTSAAKIEDFRHHIPEGTTIFVTFLPGSDFRDTLDVVRRLRSENMHPVPHLAARSINNAEMLNVMLGGLAELHAVSEVLIIGGGVDTPMGDFDSSVQLLETGLFVKHGVRKIGIAGHPEGSPDISDAAIKQALLAKMAYAEANDLELYIATQFCFEAEPIIQWLDMLRDWGCALPVHIGVPGPATIKTLLKFAQISGIGNSMRFIKKQAANVSKLLMQQAPDRLIRDLAHYTSAHPDCAMSHCHLYPFASFAKTAAWLSAVQQGRIALQGKGFQVTEENRR